MRILRRLSQVCSHTATFCYRSITVAYAASLLLMGAVVIFVNIGPAPASVLAPLPHLSQCFGHQGVQFKTLDAYLCEVKLGDDPAGGLYFMVTGDAGQNNANPNGQVDWYKLHPAKGDYYVFENLAEPWGGSSKKNGRQVVIDEGPLGQCLVAFTSWSSTPTHCAYTTDGGAIIGPEHAFNKVETSTMVEFMKVMKAEIPGTDR